MVTGTSPVAAASKISDLPGGTMGLGWAVPFAGLLLTIAVAPLLFEHMWARHYGKIAALWAALAILPMGLAFGGPSTAAVVARILLIDFLPFIILLFALYTIAGGILVTGHLSGRPLANATLLLIGAGLASVVGTTGASMILIRPLIRANDQRKFNAHIVVFFIFLVSNIGGSLTPLGDPPLFVGFLRGVDFFWTTRHLLPQTAFVVGLVIAVFLLIDLFFERREKGRRTVVDKTPAGRLAVRGLVNLPLLAGVVAAIIGSALFDPGIALHLFGIDLALQNVLRDGVILALAGLSMVLTRRSLRTANDFAWEPIIEVAKLFLAIFLCIIPVIAMLQAGLDGAFAPLVGLVTGADGTPNAHAYFWLTGGLSSFLDNAPTYVVFFELAGGDANHLMGPLAPTLAAISAGAVFMGANTYIGNAPNFMVYAIARERGVKMPSFFGYMVWSGAILLPIFLLTGYLFFA